MSSSDVIPIVLGVVVAALIFIGGRASQPRRSARFDKHPLRSIAPTPSPPPPTDPKQEP